MIMNKVFIVGAGQMGLDIGHVMALAGSSVVMKDVSDEILKASEARLIKNLDRAVSKGKMDEETKASVLSKFTFTTDYNEAKDADLILEAIVESAEVKKTVFKTLDEICKPECIFATNTSSISITELAAATKRADKFIGMHFFNPTTVMKLVEVIKGLNTSAETFKAVYEYAKEINREPVEVKEGPGFVVNRILIPMLNEAIMVYEEGLASVEDIDKAMTLGCNHPMGPLALADLIGLDTVLHIMDVYLEDTGDSKYRASRLLRQMVTGGKLGRKTGEGFYKYNK